VQRITAEINDKDPTMMIRRINPTLIRRISRNLTMKIHAGKKYENMLYRQKKNKHKISA